MVANKLYDEKKLLKSNIKKGNICLVDNKVGLKEKDIVLKTIDKKLNDELSILPKRKIKIKFSCQFLKGNKFEITVTDNTNILTKRGNIVVNAIE